MFSPLFNTDISASPSFCYDSLMTNFSVDFSFVPEREFSTIQGGILFSTIVFFKFHLEFYAKWQDFVVYLRETQDRLPIMGKKSPRRVKKETTM